MAALTAGATLGILSALLDTVGGSVVHAAYLVLAAGWAWAALAFCVGLARNRRLESVTLASASLLTAVITYYLTKLGQGEFLTADVNDPSGRTQVFWYGFWSKTVLWCIVACVIGPLLGLAGNLARNHGLRGLPFRALVPLVAIVDTSQRLEFDASPQGPVAATTWSVIRLVAVAVVVVLVGHTMTTWWPRRSARWARR
jgi:hypothetical protein